MMKILNLLKNYIFYVFATIIIIYIIVCDALISFSLSVNSCFFVASILLILLQYTINHPINKEERGPSLKYTFVQVANVMYFTFMIGMILFNVVYPKHILDSNKNYDYIIVFGAGVKEDQTDIINSRLEKACEYAKLYNRCKFVLTGAKGAEEPIEEAFYMRNYMVKRGIDDSKIIVDPFSVNTYENITNSLKLIKSDLLKRNAKDHIISRPFMTNSIMFDMDFINIGFMSSEFHLTRICLMAKKQGVPKPFCIACNTKLIYVPYSYVRENLSFIKAFVLNELEF